MVRVSIRVKVSSASPFHKIALADFPQSILYHWPAISFFFVFCPDYSDFCRVPSRTMEKNRPMIALGVIRTAVTNSNSNTSSYIFRLD